MKVPTQTRAVSVGIGLFVAFAAVTAFAHEGHTHVPPPKPTPEERAAFEAGKPAFERNCFRCHTATGKKSKRNILLWDGWRWKATMPSDEPGTVAGEDLRLILAWADAFDRAHAAPATLDALPPVEQGPKR